MSIIGFTRELCHDQRRSWPLKSSGQKHWRGERECPSKLSETLRLFAFSGLKEGFVGDEWMEQQAKSACE